MMTPDAKPKVLIVVTDGINCNVEMGRAFELAGALCEEVNLNELLDGSKSIHDFQIIAFPGGFSYGDDVKSGKIFSLKLLKLKEDFEKFIADKKLMIGICNGFQVLTTLGIIPEQSIGNPVVSLYWNESAKFECHWVDVKVPAKVNSPWLKGMENSTIRIQAAHAEGRILAENVEKLDDFFDREMVAFQYVDRSGKVTKEYPFNPNGSHRGIAGLTDKTGQILGMMPHPERNIEPFHHPDFRNLPENHTPDGLGLFINAVNYIKENF